MKKKGLSRILVVVCLVLSLALAIPLMSGCAGEKVVKVGISQLVTHPALDATKEGIIKGLADKGYVDIYLRDDAAIKFVYRLSSDAWEGYTQKLQKASAVGTYIIRV